MIIRFESTQKTLYLEREIPPRNILHRTGLMNLIRAFSFLYRIKKKFSKFSRFLTRERKWNFFNVRMSICIFLSRKRIFSSKTFTPASVSPLPLNRTHQKSRCGSRKKNWRKNQRGKEILKIEKKFSLKREKDFSLEIKIESSWKCGLFSWFAFPFIYLCPSNAKQIKPLKTRNESPTVDEIVARL